MLSISLSGRAQNSTTNNSTFQPLNFSPEKSNVQILPQKFEFTLVDSYKMKLGDILIDTAETNFELLMPNKTDKQFKLVFTWPADLLQEGQIVLFNNYGKALWSSKIDPKDLTALKHKENSDGATLRTDMVQMTSPFIDVKLLNEMKYLPFIKFCVHKSEDDSRLQLCSRDFYFSGQKEELNLKPRPYVQKTATASINGQPISGGQALIFLNDPKQNISLKAQAESGAQLEFETRMSPVEFIDAFISEDEKTLNLKASGAPPANASDTEPNATTWQAQVPLANPVLYLKGAGGVPLRQEFYIRGPVPKESYRPSARAPLENKTYSEQISIVGKSAAGTKPILRDKFASLKVLEDGRFMWTVKKLENNSENKRHLSFKSPTSEFAISHKIQRGFPYQAKLSGIFENPSSLMRMSFTFDWWFERFLALSQDWTKFHWGVQAEQLQALSKKEDFVDYSITRVSLLYRFNPGFHFVDSTWGIKIPYQLVKTSSGTYGSLGFGVFYHGENLGFKSSLMDWFNANLIYSTGAKTDSGNLLYSYELNLTAYLKMGPLSSFTYGLSSTQINFENGDSTSQSQLQGRLGLAFHF